MSYYFTTDLLQRSLCGLHTQLTMLLVVWLDEIGEVNASIGERPLVPLLPNTAVYWEWDLPINRNKICQQCLVEFALPDTSSICFTCLRRTGSLLYVYIFLTANLLFIFTFKWFLTSMHTRPEHRVTQLSSFIADACSTAP